MAESAGTSAAIEERYRKLGSIRIATKYPSITRAHFARTGTQVEIVYLHGNIELAPITGMAERIVDITATGTTLRENNLEIVEEVLASTARFFANGCALRTDERIVALARVLADHAASGQLRAHRRLVAARWPHTDPVPSQPAVARAPSPTPIDD